MDPTTSKAEIPGVILTPADIAEFQQLVEAETGVKLDTVTAWTRATELIALVRMMIKPIPEDRERVVDPVEVLDSLPAQPPER